MNTLNTIIYKYKTNSLSRNRRLNLNKKRKFSLLIGNRLYILGGGIHEHNTRS